MAFSDYILDVELGRGAAGTVWRAHRHDDPTPLAIKITHSRFSADPVLMRRFAREARTVRALEHPHITPVIDHGAHEDSLYMVMPFVEGETLAERIDRDGAMSPTKVARLLVELLDALAYAHGHGVLHRDIKAENILVTPSRGLQLLDFGLALLTSPDASRLTKDQTTLGTPLYMSPEQWQGGEIDERADLFSVGVLAYWTLHSRFPFPGSTPFAILKRLDRAAHDPIADSLPTTLSSIISRALAREPSMRWPNAARMRDALEEWLRRPALPSPALTSSRHPTSTPTIETMTARPPTAKEVASSPIEIAPDTYWVGKRPPGEIFYANPYLRVFENETRSFNLIIDPGSSSDFAIVSTKCRRVLGSLDQIHAVFINHQDPDVGSSTGVLMSRHSPDSHVLCTEDTWRLVQYYNIPRQRFIALEKYPEGFSVPTGQTLVPVPSPFCHFVGAMMLYDPATRVLFTGDLFGALTDRDATGLEADGSDWAGMRAFHQIYMPTSKAIQNALANIRALDPPPEILAPQHGRLLRGEVMEDYMRRLEELPVGLDVLMDTSSSRSELTAWSAVLNRVLDTARSMTTEDVHALLREDAHLGDIIKANGRSLEITSMGKFAVERAVRLIGDALDDPDVMSAVKYEVVFATHELDLPTPVMDLDEDGPAGGHL